MEKNKDDDEERGLFDFGNVEIPDFDPLFFDLDDEDLPAENRYTKPKFYNIKPNFVCYDNADKLAHELTINKGERADVFVVGDIRDKKGVYRNFVGDTIKAFTDCGLLYYNHLILVNQICSLAIRVRRSFQSSRKIGKTHQNVLAFYKGELETMPEMFEQINLKKAIEQFNQTKEATENHEDVLCFYKGNVEEIRQEFGDVERLNNTDI
jgi:hypothetical protein